MKESPNCIPNFQRYLYFDEKIRGIISQFNFKLIQYFPVAVKHANGKRAEQTFMLANVQNLINAIDREKSTFEIDEDEVDEEDNIRFMSELWLNKSSIGDEVLFRLIGFETLLIVREDLAQELINSGCSGLEFYSTNGFRP
jgi:hypothetical protein